MFKAATLLSFGKLTNGLDEHYQVYFDSIINPDLWPLEKFMFGSSGLMFPANNIR